MTDRNLAEALYSSLVQDAIENVQRENPDLGFNVIEEWHKANMPEKLKIPELAYMLMHILSQYATEKREQTEVLRFMSIMALDMKMQVITTDDLNSTIPESLRDKFSK